MVIRDPCGCNEDDKYGDNTDNSNIKLLTVKINGKNRRLPIQLSNLQDFA